MEEIKLIKMDLFNIEVQLKNLEKVYKESLEKYGRESDQFTEKLSELLKRKRLNLQKLAKLTSIDKVKEKDNIVVEEIKENKKFDFSKLKKYPKKVAIALGFGLTGLLSLTGLRNVITKNQQENKEQYEVTSVVNQEDMIQVKTSNFTKPKEVETVKYKDQSYYTYFINENSKIKCSHFEIGKVAVLDGNTIIDVLSFRDKNQINFAEIKEKYNDYGCEISLLVSVNGYDKSGKMVFNNVSWTPVDTFIKENSLKKVKTMA